MTVNSIIDATIGKEGGYVDHPDDRGGPTRWGITEKVARANGYTGDMRMLPRETAILIYRNEYFIKPGFARVATVSEAIAEELFDTGVNMGTDYPRRWLQQWLNALNRGGTDYADIAEDGAIGGGTIAALKSFIAVRGKTGGESVMLKALNGSQTARYLDLARNRVQNESFVFGWLANRIGF